MRTLKALVATAVIALLAGAVAVPASHAATYDSSKENTTYKGSQVLTNVFSSDFGVTECETVKFEGTQGSTTAKTMRLHPTYSECEAFGFEATVNTTGCDFEFGEPTSVGGTFNWHAVVGIVCSGANAIKITAVGGLCQITIPGQALTGWVEFDVVGKMWVMLNFELESVAYQGTGGFCGGPVTFGTYAGFAEFAGSDSGGGTAELNIT